MVTPTLPSARIDELLPCPFCGEHPVADDKSIWCPNHDCWGPFVENYDNLSDAIAAWNRRPSPSPAKGEAEPVAWGTGDDYERYERVHNTAIASYEAHTPGDYRYSATALRHAVDDAIREALASPLPVEDRQVRVKPLEWRQLTSPREDGPAEPIAEWEADCVIGTYFIEDDGGEWWLRLADLFDTHHVGRSNDPDALRQIAQSDLQQRILSALSPSTLGGDAGRLALSQQGK